jgi:CRP-like cAMP-binding protein
MPYRLVKGIYAVRCRHAQCPFHDQMKIDENIVGVTEEDVRTEAMKMARDQATVKHDSIYGRKHGLESPEIHMVSGVVQKLGPATSSEGAAQKGVTIRRFGKGAVILKKGDAASTVCEVLQGTAYPVTNKSHRYVAGDCFGVAALVPNHTRLSDVVAQSNGTTIAFYDLGDLRQNEPGRASSVVSRILDDTLRVVDELGRAVSRLRSKGKHRMAS